MTEESIREYISTRLKANKRKNDASYHYWYPLGYASYGEEEILSALDSLVNFKTTMSKKCEKFEDDFSSFVGADFSVFLNSGSSADLLAISSVVKSPIFDLNVGDRVLVPAITWPTQIWSIRQAGLVPVLFDCDRYTFNPDITTVPEEVLVECKAIFITHILGSCADMDTLMEFCQKYDLILLEDTAESLGASYNQKMLGTFGCCSVYSTFFSHHITTIEGGVVVTNNEDLNLQLRLMRSHGWARALGWEKSKTFASLRGFDLNDYSDIDSRYMFVDDGFNLRPNEITASFGIEQLKRLNNFNAKRKHLSNLFYDQLRSLRFIHGPAVVDKCDPCFMALPMRINEGENLKELIAHLETRGVETRPLIAGNIQRHPVAKRIQLECATSELDGSDYHHTHSFYVGLTPFHSESDIHNLFDIIASYDANH